MTNCSRVVNLSKVYLDLFVMRINPIATTITVPNRTVITAPTRTVITNIVEKVQPPIDCEMGTIRKMSYSTGVIPNSLFWLTTKAVL